MLVLTSTYQNAMPVAVGSRYVSGFPLCAPPCACYTVLPARIVAGPSSPRLTSVRAFVYYYVHGRAGNSLDMEASCAEEQLLRGVEAQHGGSSSSVRRAVLLGITTGEVGRFRGRSWYSVINTSVRYRVLKQSLP